jgi:hypothetical protein
LNAGRRDEPADAVVVTGAALTWFPFTTDGYSLRESFTGTSLPKNLLT